MKNLKMFFYLFLALVMLIIPLAGCNKDDYSMASYSDGIDENGYWKGVKAANYVNLFDYKSMSIPAAVHKITDEALKSSVDSVLSNLTTKTNITDRAVVDGDTVNIDYVGSIDEVEFSGGSTGGNGTEVTIGVTSYIDDFLEQLIGHKPGETVNVHVTFPDDYGKDDLNGKDALFVTVINHIIETNTPELTDALIESELGEKYGWKTVEEMKASLTTDLQKRNFQNHLRNYTTTDVDIKSVPKSMTNYQIKFMLKSLRDGAESSGVTFAEYLESQTGVTTAKKLIEQEKENSLSNAKFNLVCQAIAEDANLIVTEEIVAEYFLKNFGSADYSQAEEYYGIAYIKQNILCVNVIDYIFDHATLA